MLELIVLGEEYYDSKIEEFRRDEMFTLKLEHSLVSLSKWEEIFEKPFLSNGEKTDEEILAYVKCMIIDPDFPPEVFQYFDQKNFDSVGEYINAKRTATWFSDTPGVPRSREVVTSELIYYWMIEFNIPMECQYWHLQRLFTLIRVCNLKHAKPKPLSPTEAAARQRQLNEQRKAQYNTKG